MCGFDAFLMSQTLFPPQMSETESEKIKVRTAEHFENDKSNIPWLKEGKSPSSRFCCKNGTSVYNLMMPLEGQAGPRGSRETCILTFCHYTRVLKCSLRAFPIETVCSLWVAENRFNNSKDLAESLEQWFSISGSQPLGLAYQIFPL